jgi:hypothetical protein
MKKHVLYEQLLHGAINKGLCIQPAMSLVNRHAPRRIFSSCPEHTLTLKITIRVFYRSKLSSLMYMDSAAPTKTTNLMATSSLGRHELAITPFFYSGRRHDGMTTLPYKVY